MNDRMNLFAIYRPSVFLTVEHKLLAPMGPLRVAHALKVPTKSLTILGW